MTSDPVDTDGSPATDPMARLRRRIERARDLAEAPPSEPGAPNGEDPLERLQRRVDRASSPDLEVGPTMRPPSLQQLFDQARRQREEPVGYPEEVEVGDPIERLRHHVDLERKRIGSRSPVPPPVSPGATRAGTERNRERGSGEGSETALGREVTRLLETRDLPGEARAEAARRLATQIEAPEPGELRAILRILVTGD